jgi:TIR domain-containing protein
MGHIRLYHDGTIDLDIEDLSANLNSVCNNITFSQGITNVNIDTEIIKHPDTHNSVYEQLESEIKEDFKAIIITIKEYDDNYFFKISGNLIILTFYAWEQLTTLPLSNGVVFFIADLLALHIDHSFRHYEDEAKPKPECIYDFGWNKTGVDIGMRSSLICPTCIKRIGEKRLTAKKLRLFEDLKLILNDLGNASKWESDIFEYWGIRSAEIKGENNEQKGDDRNQVFISYSHKDSKWLSRLKTHLSPFERNDTIHVWEDTKIKTGRDWRQEIEQALEKTKIAVLMISADFLASDFIMDNELPSLFEAARENGAIIMPIILCGYPESSSRLRICAGQLLSDLTETILISSKNGIYQQI